MRNHHLHFPVQRTVALVMGSFLLAQSVSLALGATNATATAASNAATNAPEVEIPKSVFAIPSTRQQGRDPFFPLSRRLMVEPPTTTTTTTNTPPVARATPVSLALKGISSSDAKRFALINDKTFLAGEELEVSTGGTTRVRVHCLEVRENSVVVEVNGVRQELRLRPGL